MSNSVDQFAQVLADCKDSSQVTQVLASLCTDKELKNIANRLQIAQHLNEGKSYNLIRDSLKVSSATISMVAERLNTKGFKLALQKLTLDQKLNRWLGLAK